MPKQFAFCSVCRRNHDQGKAHKYGVKHKQRRDQLLGRAHRKIQEVQLFLRNATPLREEDKGVNKFWCYFCEEDITEEHSVFACSNAIRHLGSSKHVERVRAFWAEHGGDFQNQLLYSISEEDLQQWRAECDVAILGASGGQVVKMNKDGNFQDPSSATLSEQPLPCDQASKWGGFRHEQVAFAQTDAVCEIADPLVNGIAQSHTPRGDSLAVEDVGIRVPEGTMPSFQTNYKQSLTSIPRPTMPEVGNVHTGAPPPWLKPQPGAESSSAILSRSQERKLAKLRNPKRVGAAWAEQRRAELAANHQKSDSSSLQTNAEWLPKFGRVWQSGSRRESRREFEAEKKLGDKRGLPAGSPLPASDVKPYISKRQRQESKSDSAT